MSRTPFRRPLGLLALAVSLLLPPVLGGAAAESAPGQSACPEARRKAPRARSRAQLRQKSRGKPKAAKKPSARRKTKKKATTPRARPRQVVATALSRKRNALYRAAKSYAAGRSNPLKKATPAERKRLLAKVSRALAPGPGKGKGKGKGKKARRPTNIKALQKRSGAATLLLALAEATPAKQGRGGWWTSTSSPWPPSPTGASGGTCT